VSVVLPRCVTLVVCGLLVLASPALGARGSGGDRDRDARVTGRCGKGATSQLRLRSHDGSIRMEFEVKRRRPRERWRVVVVHERRVAWRGTARTGDSGSLRVRRSLDDYDGVDRVTIRASGPDGLECTAYARLLG
jgi:hypothetical protein